MTEQQTEQGPIEANQEPGGRRSLRDPGGPTGALLAWLAIIGVVSFLALTPVVHTFFPQLFEKQTEGPVVIEHTPPSGPMRLIAKYSLGASTLAPGGEEQLLEQVDAFAASSPSDKLRAAIVTGAMLGPEAGRDRLDALEDDLLAPVEGKPSSEPGPEFSGAFAIVKRVFTEGSDSLDETQRDSIVASEGWFGELLLVSDLPEDNPARAAFFQAARRVTLLLVGAMFALFGVGFVGLGLFITAIVLFARGRIRPAYAPPARGGSVYLEMFALFLVSFLLIETGAGIVYNASGIDLSRAMVWLILPVMFWPLARGTDLATWKHAVGWHKGRGVLHEIGAGILGYLAGLPIVAVGLVCAIVLSVFVGWLVEAVTGNPGAAASHPAIDEIGQGGVWGVVSLYLLASVWAPLFEETFFRGALYHHMRGRFGFVGSALIVAFIFASIHPQGIGLIPALMGLAVVFAMIREWRGSIIGCMVAHGLHNATLVTVLLLALG